MATKYYCPNCDWSGFEPNESEYEDSEQGRQAFEADLKKFKSAQANHDCKETQ